MRHGTPEKRSKRNSSVMQCQCHNPWSSHCFTFTTFTFCDQCAASDLGHLFSVMMTALRFETFETLWLCLDVSVPGSSSLCECKDGSTEAACNTVLEEDRKGGDVQALHTHTRCSRWSRVCCFAMFCVRLEIGLPTLAAGLKSPCPSATVATCCKLRWW